MFHRRIFSSSPLTSWELASITGGVKCNQTNACKVLMCKSNYIYGMPLGPVFTSSSHILIEYCYTYHNKAVDEQYVKTLSNFMLRVGIYSGRIAIPEYVKSGDLIVLQPELK